MHRLFYHVDNYMHLECGIYREEEGFNSSLTVVRQAEIGRKHRKYKKKY
jgi:hypothetical protein